MGQYWDIDGFLWIYRRVMTRSVLLKLVIGKLELPIENGLWKGQSHISVSIPYGKDFRTFPVDSELLETEHLK